MPVEANFEIHAELLEDKINRPAHYTTGKIEVWDFIFDQQLDYHSGNIVKYICRAGRKTDTPLEDLKVTWTLVYSKERELGSAAQHLIEILVEITQEKAKAGKWPGLTLKST